MRISDQDITSSEQKNYEKMNEKRKCCFFKSENANFSVAFRKFFCIVTAVLRVASIYGGLGELRYPPHEVEVFLLLTLTKGKSMT